MDRASIIGSASAGRALRGWRVVDEHERNRQSALTSQEIVLEAPRADTNTNNDRDAPVVRTMGPEQPVRSFIACFHSSSGSQAFREDVVTKGWSAAVKLHTDSNMLLALVPLGSDIAAYLAFASQQTPHSTSWVDDKATQVCFTHCLFVPTMSFQIPRSAMRLSRDALAQARANVHDHSSAARFLDAFHSHVSSALYHVGGIFFHELCFQTTGLVSFRHLLHSARTVFNGGLDLYGDATLSETHHEPLLCKVHEATIVLGCNSRVEDANDFLLKLKEDPSVWAIIDKQADTADTLMSIWEIIYQQLPSLEADAKKMDRLRKSAGYLSRQWQDTAQGSEHPLIRGLLRANERFQRMASGDSSSNTNMDESNTTVAIPPLPEKISLPQLVEELLIEKTHMRPLSDRAAAFIKTFMRQPGQRSEVESVAIDRIVSYGFERYSGNFLYDTPLSYPHISSLNLELQNLVTSSDNPTGGGERQLQQLGSGGPSYMVLAGEDPSEVGSDASSSSSAGHNDYRTDARYSQLRYAWDMVTDRPFLQVSSTSSAAEAAGGTVVMINKQAKRMLDCLRHRVDALLYLSQIRGITTDEAGDAAAHEDQPDDNLWTMDDDDDDDDAMSSSAGQRRHKQEDDVSPFELIVHLLRISDMPMKAALYTLLLEQRAAVPLLHTSSLTFGPSVVVHELYHHAQALGFVDVKLPREQTIILTADTTLPRVVFLSMRAVPESRAAIFASKALSCNFMSQYNREEMYGGCPGLEVGLGFLKPSQVQPPGTKGSERPAVQACLAIHVNGKLQDHAWIVEFVKDTADVILLELESIPDSIAGTSGMFLDDAAVDHSGREQRRQIEVLHWVDGREQRVEKKKRLVTGGETYVVNQIQSFLRSTFAKMRPFQGPRKSLAQICVARFRPGDAEYPSLLKRHEAVLAAVDFSAVKWKLCHQRSFNRESRMQFQLLKLKHNPAERRATEMKCLEERKRRAEWAEDAVVTNNPLMTVFREILSMPDATSRRVGMMWLERGIAERMKPVLKDAEKRKDDSLERWHMDPSNAELRSAHLRRKQEYVDKAVGIVNLWRELCHMFVATGERRLATLAAQHLLDAFPLEILDGDAAMFCAGWVQAVLAELDVLTSRALGKGRPARIFVLSVMGLQSSGKSTLLNLMFGMQLRTSAGRCTRGVQLQLVKSERPDDDRFDYVLVLDTEGIRSPEFHGLEDASLHDNRLATFGLLPADASIFMATNEDDNGLKEVLPMVLLAFQGSKIAESYTSMIRSKMFFVYRSVDTNDKTKLKENMQKLREHLSKAAEDVARMNQPPPPPPPTMWSSNPGTSGKRWHENDNDGGTTSWSSTQPPPPPSSSSSSSEAYGHNNRAAASGEMLRWLFSSGGMLLDVEDESKSDVKYMGNLKRGHTPPEDVPDWAYGQQIIDMREYIHERVTGNERWKASSLKEWSTYLGLVWDCILEADFDLSFKSAMERVAYDDLRRMLHAGPRLQLSKGYMEEFEKVERGARSGGKQQQQQQLLQADFERNVFQQKRRASEELERLLEQRQEWARWKDEEVRKWELFCGSLERDYADRLREFFSGHFEFEAAVSGYEQRMRSEIVELIDEGGEGRLQKAEERDEAFRGILERILEEAQRKHEPFADRVALSVQRMYDSSELSKMFQLHSDEHEQQEASGLLPESDLTDDVPAAAIADAAAAIADAAAAAAAVAQNKSRPASWKTAILESVRNSVGAIASSSRAAPGEYASLIRKLEAAVEAHVAHAEKYDDSVVLRVIESASELLGQKSRDVRQNGHRFVMATLVRRLKEKQNEWDRKHNVAMKLREAEPRLRAFFDDYARGVGAAHMLTSELGRLLEAHLPDAYHDLLITSVVDHLANRSWMISADAMHACLDLHLLILLRTRRLDDLFTRLGDGRNHFHDIADALIGHECQRLYSTQWDTFFRSLLRCLQDATATVRDGRRPELQHKQQKKAPSVQAFVDELRHQLQTAKLDPSGKLTSSILSRIAGDQYKDLDADQLSEKVRELQESLSQKFQEQRRPLPLVGSSDLVRRVRQRMEQLRDERMTLRCAEECPRCGLTCILAQGHAGRHDTVHQPIGLTGVTYKGTMQLVELSCLLSFQLNYTIVKEDGRVVPFKDFDKEFPTWRNPSANHLNSTHVREYVFYNFQDQLVAYHNRYEPDKSQHCKKFPRDNMPSSYANHSLNSLSICIRNKLAESFLEIEHTLMGMDNLQGNVTGSQQISTQNPIKA